MTATDTHRSIEAIWRIESARIIAGLARMLRDVGLAEELAQDALVTALEQWPQTRVLEAEQADAMPRFDAMLDDDIGDDLLRLIFTACHPALPAESRVALTLRLLGGLSTVEIARAFLQPEPTIAQRIVRAKRTLAEKQVPFEVPRGEELAERLDAVLGVIYLVFNEGYTATAGDDWMRPALCEEALRLGRILAG